MSERVTKPSVEPTPIGSTSPDELPPVSAADVEPASAQAPTPGLTTHLPEPAPDRRWRLLDRLVVLVFCLSLVVPGALLAVGRRSALIENRPLLKPPAFSVGGLLDPAWYTAIDRFLTDNDALRPIAVRLRGEAYWKLGGTGNPDVVKGRGNWMFTKQEIAPRCDLTAGQVASALDTIHDEFAAAGQDFRFVLAPDKHVIYPEMIDPSSPYPPGCTESRRPEMEAFLDAHGDWAINGWAELRAAKAADPSGPLLFFDQDSHWTPTGSVPAIRDLVRSLEPDAWSDADIAPGATRRAVMELARQVGLNRIETVPRPTLRPTVHLERSVVQLPFQTHGAKAVYRVLASGDRPLIPGRTVVVFDSFFGLNIEAVSPYFAETIWIHQNDLTAHPEVAQLIGPIDRVIFERVERGLYYTQIVDLLRPLVRTGG